MLVTIPVQSLRMAGLPVRTVMSSLSMLLVSFLLIFYYKFSQSLCAISGAGIYAIVSDTEVSSGPIPNNGLIVSGSDELKLECVSNSSQSGVGTITILNGTILTPDVTTSVWNLTNPSSRPGVIRFQNLTSFTSSDQGIFTCTIPDDNGNQISFNVGLYPHGFNGEQIM